MHDLAISAVPYDAILVAELSERLAPRLRTVPFWAGNRPEESIGDGATPRWFDASARLALILHQRLWQHDITTKSDQARLRERIDRHPGSVRVVMLDDEPLPDWLKGVPCCALPTVGLDAVVEFTVEGIRSSGGTAPQLSSAALLPEPPEPRRPWAEGATPFLSQPRAVSALRRELDLLASELKVRLRVEQNREADRGVDLQVLPHRLTVRFRGVGMSFSWVAGRVGTVADGRLLVIQWEGATPRTRGIAAMASATAVRERVYRAEGTSPETWCWRDDVPNGRAWSTANLVAEWVAGASLASTV